MNEKQVSQLIYHSLIKQTKKIYIYITDSSSATSFTLNGPVKP